MKRTTQLVALVVALLFAAQSALAETSCAMWLASDQAHAPACCAMASNARTNQLAAHCHGPMPSETGTVQCNESGCGMATVQAVAQAVKATKIRANGPASQVVGAQLLAVPEFIQQAPSSLSPAASRPARYLLFQAFRI